MTLSMICKNESPVIARALESCKPHISSFSVSDTGSTDSTKQIIAEALADIPGMLFSDTWQDFSTNRNLSLSRCIGEYVLILDADEILEKVSDEPLPDAEEIRVKIVQPNMEFWSTRILKNDGFWQWVGKVHEVPVHDGPVRTANYGGFVIHATGGGNQNTGNKFEAHLKLFEQTPREMFYHARTLFDLGRFEDAILKFEERILAGGFDEEIYYSLYQIAQAKWRLSYPVEDVAAAFYRAYIYRPSRTEALNELRRMLSLNGKPEQAGELPTREQSKTDVLFVSV